jgi:two-component system chemotaxis sensor kinase CheA
MDFGDIQELQAGYRNEAADLLADLGDALLLLEQDHTNIEVVNRVFRAMHTLKGSGASAGFRRLANFVHHVEDVFNRVRNRQLETTPELIDATLKACDCCAILLQLDSADAETPVPLEAEVLAAIRPFLPEASNAVEAKVLGVDSGPSCYRIGFRPNREIFFSGTDPASLLLELTDLGKLDVVCDPLDLLAVEDFDPEQCYLRWEAVLDTDQPESAVRGVFQFVEEDCQVSIEREQLASAVHAENDEARFLAAAGQCFSALVFAVRQCESGEEEQGLTTGCRSAQTLVSVCQAGSQAAIEASQTLLDALMAIRNAGEPRDSGWLTKILGMIDTARKAAAPQIAPLPTAVSLRPKTTEPAPAEGLPGGQSIRVDSVKLDALMRLAGELLVARGALPSFAERIEKDVSAKSLVKEMRDAGAKVSRLADDLQATVMSIRMMPVRQVFQRFPRLIRDIARTLDKNIELEVSGEETELDKTVIDSIGDPLTHIIRNAADHGIESKAERLRKGKTAAGRIQLSAYTRGSNVTIEIRDDGKGLDAEKLKRRAVEKGLFSESAVSAMDEQAAFKIILEAGFSTVDQVTDLSGRGVGMDVVRTSVEALSGAIHIQSEKDKGTCFRIELPASLLVSKGILVAASGQQVVLPMDTIRNMVKVSRSLLRSISGQLIVPVRGAVFPVLSLAHALAFERDDEDAGNEPPPELLAIGIIEAMSGPYALIVDRFIGEVEVVVKPLSGVLAHMPEYVGASIMGDGKTVLVVNTERLFSLQTAGAIARNAPVPALSA